MEYPPSRTNGELNFLKGSLLLTDAIAKGLQTLVTNIEEEDVQWSQSYHFQKLCNLLLTSTNSPDTKLQHGLTKLADVRKQFFKYVSQQSMLDKELEAIKEQIVTTFEELELPLSDVYEIYNKSSFREDDVLTAHEKLSLERRDFCFLGHSCHHTTIQRTVEVSTVLEQLNELSQRNQNGNSTLFIDGQYGSGKREFAKQVAEALNRVDHKNKPMPVMTLNAETEQTLLSSYVSFAKELLCNFTQIQMAVTSKGLLLEERLRLLKHIIGDQLKTYPCWVVVMVNMNHFESLFEFWPKPGSNDWGHGYLIVTLPSINDVKSSSLDFAGHVSLSHGMQPSQAIQLLSEVSGITEVKYCLEVAEILEFQPLSLSCAAVFVRNQMVKNFGSPWKVFLELFREYNVLCQDVDKEAIQSIYSQSCSTAMNMLLMQVLSRNHGISDVSYLFTLFQPFHVEKEMLSNCLTNITDSNIVDFLHDISPFLSIERNAESDLVSLRHHIPDGHKSELDETRVEIFALAAISLAHKFSSLKNVRSILSDCIYSVCCRANLVAGKIRGLSDDLREAFINHLIKCTTADNDAVDILMKLTDQCHYLQAPERSKTLLSIAKSVLEKEQVLDAGRFVRVLHGLGVVSCDIGSDDAKEYLDKSLEFYCQDKDVSHEKVADVLLALGDVAVASDDLANAKAFYRKALKTSSTLGRNMGVPLSWYKVGNVLAIEGSFQLAKEHYEEALKLMDDVDFVNLTKALTCVGAMSICVDEYHLAKEYLAKAMAIEQRLYSRYHPYRLSSIKNAANACKALGDLDSAERLLQESIAISQNITCQWNADVAQVFSQLGSLRTVQEDWESAIEFYGTALEIQENILQCHLDPVIADRCCDLGLVYAKSGQLEIAKSFHERALGIRGLLFQGDHPDIGTSYFQLGKVYNKLGDHQTASSLLERAVEIRGKVFGPQHPETLDSLYYLGHSFARLGRLKNARTLYQSVAEGQVKLKGSNSTALAKTSESLGEVNLGLGEIEFAKQQFKRAIEIQKCVTGPDHPEVARPLVRLALVHEHCKEMKEAKTLLEIALAIYRKNINKIARSHVIVTEAHLKRVLLKLPQNRCILM